MKIKPAAFAVFGMLAQIITVYVLQAEDFLQDQENGKMPDGMKISLESDKTNYFLGENILLYYRIENVGDKPFHISTGGDYRGSTRADRFKVSAISAGGKPVADPTPLMGNFGGGLMPNADVKPGDSWYEKVWVIEYCRFEDPGTYTIQAFHDLGFGAQHDADARSVSMKIELRAPTEAQALTILDEADNAKPYYGSTWGQKGEARLDYHCIRYPAFLPALVERAQQKGDQNAVEGINSIRTLEATRALVKLLNHTNTDLAKKAAACLEWRLPHSQAEFQGPWGEMRKQYYVENAWDEKLTLPVRDYSRHLLANTNRGDLLLATSLLKRIGSQTEAPALLKALEFGLKRTNGEFLADIHYPPPIRVCDELLGAAMTINSNLNVSPDDIQTPGQALLFIAKRGGSDRKLSSKDEAVFAKLARHNSAYVRMRVMESLPKEIPSSLADTVTERMTDTDVAVQNYAFDAARRMNEPRHRAIALTVLKETNEEWLRRAANDIALKYGARYECAMVWVSHLVPPKDINDYLSNDVIQHLFEIIVGHNTSGSLATPKEAQTAQVMRERWEKFLTANKEKIEAGHEFRRDEVPADLGMHF